MAKRIVLSDGNKVNSKGYRIDLTGMNTERFSSNPVMLYGHDQDKVIGRWENWNLTNNKFEADPVFDDGDTFGAEIKRKYENDFLRAASIGLIVLDMQLVDDVWTVTKSELLEASIVSIPADAGAVVLYNENKEVLTFEQLQLNFTENKNKQPENKEKMELKLSEKTIESLGLSGEITAKEVELAVAEKDRTIKTLKEAIEKAEKKHQSDYLENAVKVGKITESEKESYLKLCENGGFENVKTIIDAKAETASETLADKVQKSELTAGREKWDYMQWMKDDPSGLQKLKIENPKEFERLQQTLKSKKE